MKISFYSNYLNHHQIPFCNEMYRMLGNDFKFIATEPMENERVSLGWGTNMVYPYEIRSYEHKDAFELGLKLGMESDVVITGSAPEIFIAERIKKNTLTFRYSERFFKKGAWQLLNPRTLLSCYSYHTHYRNKNLHMLCASAYTASDAALLLAYPNKTYKWGYFTEVKTHEFADLESKKTNENVSLLWCGRFIDWKHPEKSILVLEKLIENGFNCQLSFVGDGPLLGNIKSMAKGMGLSDRVVFHGAMAAGLVREHMEKANIYLFTSNRREGWGAVLNEAMNSGCAVAASYEAGATPYLVQHGINGFVYKNSDTLELYRVVESLVKSAELRKQMGSNAMASMANLWNPRIAAERLIELSDGLLNVQKVEFADGPCSRV